MLEPGPYEHHGADRLVAVVDGAGARTEYRYDKGANLVEQEDANDRATRFVYDELGRRTRTSYPECVVPHRHL